MAVSIDDVRRVCNLARMTFSEQEMGQIASELTRIVTMVDQLGEVDTENVDPMVHAIELANVLQADTVQASLPRQQVLENAQSKDDECFRVPAVLG